MNFVPGAYYDLIARACPGMAFWMAFLLMKSLPFGKDFKFAAIDGADLFVLILLSYVAGIVLTGFSVVWDGISLRCLFFLRENIGLQPGTGFFDQWEEISSLMDAIALRDRDAGRTLVKAMAEVTLCQNLLSGLFVIAWLSHTLTKTGFDLLAGQANYFIVISIALFISMLFRQAMFLGRLKGLHALSRQCPVLPPQFRGFRRRPAAAGRTAAGRA